MPPAHQPYSPRLPVHTVQHRTGVQLRTSSLATLRSRRQHGMFPPQSDTHAQLTAPPDCPLQLPIAPPRHPSHHLHFYLCPPRLPGHHGSQQGHLLLRALLEVRAHRRASVAICVDCVCGHGGTSTPKLRGKIEGKRMDQVADSRQPGGRAHGLEAVRPVDKEGGLKHLA